MTSYERVKRTIYFKQPDRIPHYLPDGLENDILWLAPWTMGDNSQPPDQQGWQQYGSVQRRLDAWGVTWERSTMGQTNMGQAKGYPITDLAGQEDYTFPSRNDRVYYRSHQRAIDQNKDATNPKYVLGVPGFASLNEGVHNIVGLETMFTAYYEQPEHLKALIGRFARQQQESIRLLAELGCDGVMAYDDWGLQDRLMVSRSLIEEFFMPHYRQNWQLAHDLDLDVWLHSCGYIIDLLPEFHHAGLDVIQMDQQENMGLENLSRIAGGKLAFWCPVDIQKNSSREKPQEIERYVKKMMATLGNHKGGLISMAYTSPEAIELSPDRIAVMCHAFRKYGCY
ncbi:hypothetical protein GF407_06240 [candidate division KSB1 bacterium]|nr:hypothetical protein [candidate division KSB1 bacterium]